MRIPSGIDLFSPGSFIYTRVRVSSAREGEQQVQQNEAPSSRAPLLGTLQERIGLFGYFRVRGAGAQEVTQRVQPSEASGPQEPLLDTLQKVETLRETLETIDPQRFKVRTLVGTSVTSTPGAPAATTSAADLGFDTNRPSTPTTLRSTEEVNATPTSFSPFDPTFVGSTAQPTIGGLYLGTNGTGTLKFVVDRGGTHGQNNLKIKVYNPNDSFFQDINIKKTDPAVDVNADSITNVLDRINASAAGVTASLNPAA